MFFSLRLMLAGLALLPLAAFAQTHPADALAAVPAASYTSVFNNYRPATDQAATPDKLWRAANDEVQRHADHMMGAGSSTAASVPKADAHAGHGHDSHHGKGK